MDRLRNQLLTGARFTHNEHGCRSRRHLSCKGYHTLKGKKIASQASDAQTAIEMVSLKIGTILVVLGAMHFLVFAVFAKLRSTSKTQKAEQEHLALALERRRKVGDKTGDSVWESPPESHR